jgi:regulatory protein
MKTQNPTPEQTAQDATQAAVALLARREHCAGELRRKLARKGFDATLIQSALSELQRRGLQSDARYAEGYVRGRAAKGYGAARIELELRMRGIGDEIAADALREIRDVARLRAAQVRRKKFGEELPSTTADRAKQTRYLLQRGFSHEQIRAALRGETER